MQERNTSWSETDARSLEPIPLGEVRKYRAELLLHSYRLGLRGLFHSGSRRGSLKRLLMPIDATTRQLEVPLMALWLANSLRAVPASVVPQVFDLSSNKLISSYIANRFPSARIVASDYWEGEIEEWRTLLSNAHSTPPNLELRTADGFKLPFGDGRFDIAYSLCVLDHFENHTETKVMNECHRVLKPGGKFLITIPIAAHGFTTYKEAPAYSRNQAPDGQGHFFFGNYFGPEEFREHICSSNFGPPRRVLGGTIRSTRLHRLHYLSPLWSKLLLPIAQPLSFANTEPNTLPSEGGQGFLFLEFQKNSA